DLTVWSRWFYREWEDVWVYIPEVALRVWPRREAEAVGSPNRFPGTVAEIQSHRYGMSVRVESPPLNLTAFVQQQDWEGLRLQHGDPVWLSVDPHGLHLMPVRQ
ncbi:MAG: TOBE domain-containing protein, partial [Alicyclobacillaceae bacterium]|nr:TOBE domain-containing protein [Alicyclobacillaceae bacterium]